jgi:cholesterol oxidase
VRRLSQPAEQLKDHYEIVVIGSGYGGAIAAARLSRAGRQVCLLERGREFQPGDYPSTQFEGLSQFQYNTPVGHAGSRLGLFELNLNDDLSALVGCGLGGTSLINANVSLRPEPRLWDPAIWPRALLDDRETRLEAGYRHAFDMLRPIPVPADFPQLPKLAALEKSAAGLGMAAKFSRPPINVTFTDGINHVGVEQKRCVGCGDCSSGCNYGAKNTTLMNYLPDAVAHGAEIFTGVDVRSLARRGDKWIVDYQPVAVGREDFAAPEQFITADIVIVAAGALGSTQLMLRSKSRGLALSDRVGQHLSSNGDVLAFGYNTDTPINGIGFGNRPPGEIPPVGPCIAGVIDNRDTANVRDGYVIEEGSVPGAIGGMIPAIFEATATVAGQRNKVGPGEWLREKARAAESLLRGPYHGAIANTQIYLVMGHDDAAGRMSLVDDRLRITWPGVGREAFFKTANDTLAKATAALGGGIEVPDPLWTKALGKKLITVHPLGGCIMAERAEDGVVDHAGRVFSGGGGTETYDGLWIADGSVVPTSLGVNPLLTISALAERSCAVLAEAKGWTIDYAFTAASPKMSTTKIGLSFTEKMAGVLTTQRRDGPMDFVLTIASDDLKAMLTDSGHIAAIYGTVTCPALSEKPLSVTEGRFSLFINDPTRVDTRLMVYRMVLHAAEGTNFYFHGVKTITDSPAVDAWPQTTTLAVKVYAGTDEQGAQIGSGTLHIAPLDFLTQLRTVEITNAPNTAARLEAMAQFGQYFAGVMWDSYGGVFAKRAIFDPDAPPRLKRPLRVGPPEVYQVQTEDGVTLRLTRYKGGEKGPVVLLHGAGVSSGIFSTDLVDTNLLEYLYAHGYDCWLSDFRVSIDLPSAAQPSNADQVARFDHPATIARVRELTGKPDVQVVAHCYGATTFTMALLHGIAGVRSVALSQVSTHLKVPAIGAIKAGLHLPDVVAALGVKDLTAYRDSHADWKQKLFDDALRIYPIRHGEDCNSAVCHRISFMYALLYDHKNLSPHLHDNLHELFGVCSVETFEHLARMARVGHVVAADGAEDYLPHLDRMKLPIAFIHGGDNQCFLPDSTKETYDLLCAQNGAALYTRKMVDGYGHIDSIFGQNAATDVYPHFLAHLEKTA